MAHSFFTLFNVFCVVIQAINLIHRKAQPVSQTSVAIKGKSTQSKHCIGKIPRPNYFYMHKYCNFSDSGCSAKKLLQRTFHDKIIYTRLAFILYVEILFNSKRWRFLNNRNEVCS